MDIVIGIKWEAVGAIGTWVSGIGTILAVVVAILPYVRKGKIYFTQYSNLNEDGPELVIVNSRTQGLLIEKIVFYSGPVLFRKKIYVDNFIKEQDDLVSDKGNNFIKSYTQKKVTYNSTRILYNMIHCGLKIKKFKSARIRIVVYSNLGKIKMNTKVKTKDFVCGLIIRSEQYKHLTVEDIIS